MTTPILSRIMMVEDEADIQVVARLALEALGGFTVEVCSSGDEALRKAPVFAPDLILLDVMMPGMDGPATLLSLRAMEAMSNTPIVFMTAKAQPREVAEYKRLGALDIIPKPFDPMALATTITTIWNGYHGG